MPCYDIRDTWDGEHNSVAAQLLCAVCKLMADDDPRWTPELRQWWKDHTDRDSYHARKANQPGS